jgi:4-amino-4-deoxy-L-arabinose transferase-like glycosyltransferase
VAAAYASLRAGESAGLWWPAAVGVLLGAGFLTKWLVTALVVPGLAAGYLVGLQGRQDAADRIRSGLRAGVVAAGAALVVGGWWAVLVALTPVWAHPFLDGTRTNSVIDLVFGHDGFARLGGSKGPGRRSSGLAAVRLSGIRGCSGW